MLLSQAALNPQRSLLLQGHESLNRTTDSIARTHRIAAETDGIGHNIVEELGGQREQLERTKDRVSKRYIPEMGNSYTWYSDNRGADQSSFTF